MHAYVNEFAVGVMPEKDHQDSDCSIYRSCLHCVQDPCSRTAASYSEKCHYCNGVCSLKRFPFHCPGERGDDCKRPMKTDSVTCKKHLVGCRECV